MTEITIAARDGSGSFSAYIAEPKTRLPGAAAPGGMGAAAPGEMAAAAREGVGAVIMIQEIFGVNATMRALSDWVASMGFWAISPDLFWRQKAGVQLDPDAGQAEWERAFALMNGMDQGKAVEDMITTMAVARAMPGCNGKVGTMGFCLGGRLAFMMATGSDAQCNISYYGVGLEGLVADAGRITAPALLHIAEQDKFVPPAAQAAILAGLAGHPQAKVHVYPGVDHAFARLGGHSFDARAATIANGRTAELLAQTLG